MSAWRKKALELLPEYRQLIEKSDNPMALWIDLHIIFENVFQKSNEELTKRFFDFAKWCLETPKQGEYLSDVGTAVAVAFYEHIIMDTDVRDDLHRWLSQSEFLYMESVFTYHLSEAEFETFKAVFLKRRAKYLKEI